MHCRFVARSLRSALSQSRRWQFWSPRFFAAFLLALTTSSFNAQAATADSRPVWASLTVAQQQALGPLKSEWAQIDVSRKQKWLELAARMPAMSPPERERIQQRMADWVRLSPSERGRARLQFQEAQQLAPGDRKDRWEAYQALSTDQRQALAAQAGAKATSSASAPRSDAKRNVVPLPAATAPVAQPRQVAPTVVQANTGATTSLVTTPARPPAHHQAGLPKVNARSDFVNPSTLLPRRGAQGAAVAAVPPASGATPTP